MTNEAEEILGVEGVVLYGENGPILKGIDWSVKRGEHWAILGANGCGKTTLLSAILAYRPVGEGEIRALGEHYGRTNWHEMRKRIGMVSSAIAHRVPPHEVALETVLSGAEAQLGYWTREDEEVDSAKALECLGVMNVEELADRPWRFLSQGERQKVFIARALMQDPELLILDEPCAGMDPVARERFLGSLGALARRRGGPHLVLVTHHVEEILSEAFGASVVVREGSGGKLYLEVGVLTE